MFSKILIKRGFGNKRYLQAYFLKSLIITLLGLFTLCNQEMDYTHMLTDKLCIYVIMF